MSRRAFTLIELMVVVVILSALAAMAIPTFTRYVRRAKTSEAVVNLRQIFNSAVAYYDHVLTGPTGESVAPRFPRSSDGPTPALASIGSTKREPDPSEWQTDTWDALHFSVSSPHYYAYQFDAQGSANAASFTISAFGDLDGDATYSTFLRQGTAVNGDVRGSGGIYFAAETE